MPPPLLSSATHSCYFLLSPLLSFASALCFVLLALLSSFRSPCFGSLLHLWLLLRLYASATHATTHATTRSATAAYMKPKLGLTVTYLLLLSLPAALPATSFVAGYRLLRIFLFLQPGEFIFIATKQRQQQSALTLILLQQDS